jgi:FGGY-family pentulose kinase
MRELVCAVDVGTGSARAGILDCAGSLIGRSDRQIDMHRPLANHAEHDSEQIWRAVCEAVREAREKAGVAADAIAGISFDATCSLVVRGRGGEQISVSTTGEQRWDTIVWLDHRALAEADACTATGHRVLDHAGGVMSPEMQTPKLMWLKRNRPESWAASGLLFDLADYLTWKAGGSTARSQCTLTAKWAYLAHEGGWQRDFFAAVGIDDLLMRGGLPIAARPAGTDLGPLVPEAAEALGLDTGCRVGAGFIDAFAGTVGLLGGYAEDDIERRLALIAGTSSCLMGFSHKPRYVDGIWGPYFGAGLPGHWMYEGGQSATGALLDHVVRAHGAGGEPDSAMHERITRRTLTLREAEGASFADGLHVLPDFHGNRSPFADPHARGVISGLTLDSSFDGLCRLYFRTALAIALGVRHILDHLNANGHRIDTLQVTGGHVNNPMLMELYADALSCHVEESTGDAMLLGTAMAAANAAGLFLDLASACEAMRPATRRRLPNPGLTGFYDRDYRIFLKMIDQRRELRELP